MKGYRVQDTHTQPIFNHISPIVLFSCGFLGFIFLLQNISPSLEEILYNLFALVPQYFDITGCYKLFTYALLHGSISHLGLNLLWLLIFATPIMRYFGLMTYGAIFLTGIIMGGLIYIILPKQEEITIIIGASAGVSALMGASLRFIIQPEYDFYQKPMLLKLNDVRFLSITALIIMIDIANAFFMMFTQEQNIAWQAHLMGYVTGAIMMDIPYLNKRALYRT